MFFAEAGMAVLARETVFTRTAEDSSRVIESLSISTHRQRTFDGVQE